MQSGGEALERYAMGRASSSLEALLARAPKIGRRLHDGRVDEVPVSEIRVGELLLIRPGDLVPVDGEVTRGAGAWGRARGGRTRRSSGSPTALRCGSPPSRS